jgi:tRNA A-37 threonylcarbamoyl transferase component Bud32
MSQLVAVTAGGVRWHVLPECRERLFSPDGIRLDEWLHGGQALVVKHGPHRTVYSVRLPGLSFYLKHYRTWDLRSRLRQLIRPAKARMEFDRALAVAARQVPTTVPLAVGERRHGPIAGESFLLTRSLEDARPLGVFLEQTVPGWAPTRQAQFRQRLAWALGVLIARLHDAGIAHPDLHAGNLLLRLDLGDRPHLYLIDLHAVRLARPLGWRASRENLVILNRWFILRASRGDRLRFWLAYCQARSIPPASGEHTAPPAALRALRFGLARDLEQRTWASNLCFWRHRDRRCFATNRYYYRFRSALAAGYAVRDLGRDALANLVADPDAPFRRPDAKLLKDSPSSTVVELDLAVNGVLRRVIYKRFRTRAWNNRWVSRLRPAPALRSWEYGHGLRERCLPTPRPLAVFHRRRWGLPSAGYLLTEKVPDAVDLRRYLADLDTRGAPSRRPLLHQTLEHVARLVRELHRRQLSHRDLKAANLLISRDASAGESLWLIDLVGVQRYGKLPRLRRVQNLARLHASFYDTASLTRTDKLRFLRTYLQWGLFGRTGWKRWWREINQATQAKVNRNARNGRPLA